MNLKSVNTVQSATTKWVFLVTMSESACNVILGVNLNLLLFQMVPTCGLSNVHCLIIILYFFLG